MTSSHEPNIVCDESLGYTARDVISRQYSCTPKDSFLYLPPEIRLKIYPLLLVQETPAAAAQNAMCPSTRAEDDESTDQSFSTSPSTSNSSSRSSSSAMLSAPGKIHPAILRTCRLVNAEATQTLYALNVFHAHSSLLTALPRLPPYTHPITSPRVLALMRRWHLDVRLDVDPGFDAEGAKKAFAGAESLMLSFGQSMWAGASGDSTFRLFEGVRVGKCKVDGTVEGWRVGWLEGILEGISPDDDPGRMEKEFGAEKEWDLWLHGNR
ncbi:MAG: hypothetical protein M4579_002874 [Chaenotheca gracillima]|nr:MAG: hypothetical protein M4579_002874 [Chaenotheca gracillima]